MLRRLAINGLVVSGLGISGLGGCAAPPEVPTPPTMEATHEALFETFFPTESSDLSPSEQAAALRLRAETSARFVSDPILGRDLGRLRVTSEEAWGTWRGEFGFAQLGAAEREAVFQRLFQHKDPRARAFARRVRSVYLGTVYSALGPALVGDPSLAPRPPTEVVVPALDLAPSRLRYDAETKSLSHRDGPIEFLIVGSGPAGSVLANRLTSAGRRVVLVERGSFVTPGALDTRSQGALMESRNRRTSLDGAIAIRNGSTVGGGSTVNIDLAFDPTQPLLLERIRGWVLDGRLPAERYSPAALRKAYAWVRKRMGTRALDPSEVNANNRVLWKGAKARGVEAKLYDLNRYLPSASPTPVDNKISAVRGLLLEALAASPSLSLLPDAEVTRVLLEGGRATGVEVRTRGGWDHPAVIRDPHGLKLARGTTFQIQAETVILAAGSLGSPTILLRSGITGPAIGRGLVIHPSVPLVGEFEERIDATRGLTASVYVDAYAHERGFLFEAMPGLPNYVAMMTPGSGPQVLAQLRRYRHLAGFGVMLVDTPHAENRVRLDPEGRALIDYRLRGSDPDRFRGGVAEAVRTLFAAGARRVIVPSNEKGIPPVFERAEQARLVETQLRFVSSQTILTSAHMQGSLKLSPNAASGALAPDHRVWRRPGQPYENLYVIDGSVFPTSVGANPMQAIYTFARIAADQLLEPK